MLSLYVRHLLEQERVLLREPVNDSRDLRT
jgi:hypothetical protein